MRRLEARLGLKLGQRLLIARRGELILEGPAVVAALLLVVKSDRIRCFDRLRELVHFALFRRLNSPHRAQCLALRAFDFAGIRATSALEV
jgi:hypothetical protein